MQRSVLNRATMRVADMTEVSGRVTADEVNLDRFHNRIRKVCALVAATLILPTLAYADNNQGDDQGDGRHGITVATLKGAYVTATTGSITVNGTVIPITLAGVWTFFGNGTASGVFTFAAIPGGSILSGLHSTFTTTYTRNADGVSFTATNTDPTGEVNTEELYPTLDGSTIASNQTTAGSFLSAVWTRSSGKEHDREEQ
jgi:hypothetical protein